MDVLLFIIAGIILGGMFTIIESLELNLLPTVFVIASSMTLLLLVIFVLGKLLAVEIEELSRSLLFLFFVSGIVSRKIIYKVFLSPTDTESSAM